MFDNLSFGANTRLQKSYAQDSAESSEKWCLDHIERWVEAMGSELPEKFFLAGHSRGGFMSGLYASQHPERILKLFMISPSGTGEVPDE